MPHAAQKEDTYMGYTIPAGAGVMNCVCTDVIECISSWDAGVDHQQ